MSLADLMTADLQSTSVIVSDAPAVLVYRGETITGTLGAVAEAWSDEQVGNHLRAEYEWCGPNEFTALPEHPDTLTIDGAVYMVIETRPDEVGSGVSIRVVKKL